MKCQRTKKQNNDGDVWGGRSGVWQPATAACLTCDGCGGVIHILRDVEGPPPGIQGETPPFDEGLSEGDA